MTEAYLLGGLVVGLAHQGRNRRTHLDAQRIARDGEDAWVGRTVGSRLASLVLVAIEAVYADNVKGLQVALPHAREGEAVQPGVVGDEADHAPARLLGNATLRHAEETHVQVVQTLTFRLPHPPGGPIGRGELSLLIDSHARKAIVGRIAQDDQDRRILLHPVGAVPLLLQLREGQWLLHAGLPAGEGVGEVHPGALRLVIGQGGVQRLHGQTNL